MPNLHKSAERKISQKNPEYMLNYYTSANKIKYLLINLEYYKDLKTNAKNPIKIFDVLRELSAQVYCLCIDMGNTHFIDLLNSFVSVTFRSDTSQHVHITSAIL